MSHSAENDARCPECGEQPSRFHKSNCEWRWRSTACAENDLPCLVAYDHNDDLDECAVCGWRAGIQPPFTPQRVMLVGEWGQEWEADIVSRDCLPCDLVVTFTGRTPYPGLSKTATVCTKELREVRRVFPPAATGESA